MPAPATAAVPQPSTRERIMLAGAELFRVQGYEASMDAIAAAADVSKQTLYNQFGSKEELFKAIIAARAATLRAPLNASATQEPREVLLAFARQYYAMVFNENAIGLMRTVVAASQRFPEIGRDFYEAGPKQTLASLVSWIEREERIGRLSTGNPRLAAEHLNSLLQGHQQIKGFLGLDARMSESEIAERARFCVDQFLGAYGVRMKRVP